MIFDRIDNAKSYGTLGPRFVKAFAWLTETKIDSLAVGKYEIEGTDVFALVQEYESKAPENGKWEAHRKYVDVQYVAGGEEYIGFANLCRTIPGEYDSVKDFLPVKTKADFDIRLVPGDFAVLFPYDAHMPGMSLDPAKPSKVRKVVIKIRISE
jgi:YhcH/YjgK/YiaL family protein